MRAEHGGQRNAPVAAAPAEIGVLLLEMEDALGIV
jgi:hypothetical protein